MSDLQPASPLWDVFVTDLQQTCRSLTALYDEVKDGAWGTAHSQKLSSQLQQLQAAAHLAGVPPLEKWCDHVAGDLPRQEERHHKPFLKTVIAILSQLSWSSLQDGSWEKAAYAPFEALVLGGAPPEAAAPPKEGGGRERGMSRESYYDLFIADLAVQCGELNKGLLFLEQARDDASALRSLMRAAHSIKGAAKVLNLQEVVHLAHLMEECFVSAQEGRLVFDEEKMEILFNAVDFLTHLTKVSSERVNEYLSRERHGLEEICRTLESYVKAVRRPVAGGGEPSDESPSPLMEESPAGGEGRRAAVLGVEPPAGEGAAGVSSKDRVLRVTADILNRLMALAGESLVESHWLQPFSEALLKLKRDHSAILDLAGQLRVNELNLPDRQTQETAFSSLLQQVRRCQQELNDRIGEFELFTRRHTNISERLYREVLNSRMRPLADALGGFPRMVRDLAKQLNKKVRLEIFGETTPVDREILEKLETPLAHMLRNAVDHGIERPADRVANGKKEEGLIIISAQHRAGMLLLEVRDDGKGVNINEIRNIAIRRRLAPKDIIDSLSDEEVCDFMFLPGFSSATTVTELSGRGIGLSIVHSFIQEIGGRIRVTTRAGQGVSFQLTLPLTLSVMRALLIQIAGECYALPLAKIEKVVYLSRQQVHQIEQRPYFLDGSHSVGIISASEVLEVGQAAPVGDFINLVIISDQQHSYGLIIDRFLGEKELVVHELDPLLGKVSNVSAGAFMEDGSPILILDVEDLLRSIDVMLSGGRLHTMEQLTHPAEQRRNKRILVVDDSITVREVECRLLQNQGYDVETAVNGIDGWNAVRTHSYDLIVTDVDMPRMNGIDFVKAIRQDSRLSDLPIIIVSYKEREEDRAKGLEAGANYYLTKSSFHDEKLINAVQQLIGPPQGKEAPAPPA